MHLAPPFDRLHPHAAEHAGPARSVTVTLPGDLAEWLDRTCENEAQRGALIAFALDAARDYDTRGRWPADPPAPPKPKTFEEFQAFMNGVRQDLGIEPGDPDAGPDGFDQWLEEREMERDRLTERAEAVEAARAPYGKSAAEVLARIHALPDDPPGEAPMEEIVRDIYRRRGYPMDEFKFGPDADAPPGDAPPLDAARKAA